MEVVARTVAYKANLRGSESIFLWVLIILCLGPWNFVRVDALTYFSEQVVLTVRANLVLKSGGQQQQEGQEENASGRFCSH